MSQFKTATEGVFIGPQPTEKDIDSAKQQGIKTVIDLRTPAETPPSSNEAMARSGGLDYVNIPVNKAALSPEHVDQLDSALKSNEGPFLVHCATGARAILLLALAEARRNKWSKEQVFERAREMGADIECTAEFARFVEETVAAHSK